MCFASLSGASLDLNRALDCGRPVGDRNGAKGSGFEREEIRRLHHSASS